MPVFTTSFLLGRRSCEKQPKPDCEGCARITKRNEGSTFRIGSKSSGRKENKMPWQSYLWMQTGTRTMPIYFTLCVCCVLQLQFGKFNGWPIRHENHIAWRHLLFYIICRYLQFQSSLLYIVYKRLHATTSLREKFILQLEIVVKQKNTVTVVVEEQWISEKELRDELKWSQLLSSWNWYFMHGYRVNIYMLYMSMFFNLI